MKRMRIGVLLVAMVALSIVSYGQSGEQKGLTIAQQNAFVHERVNSGQITGNFASFGSFLNAVADVAIHTEDKTIASTVLHSPFPDFYKPTWKELFNTIGMQTGASWTYDASKNFWVFKRSSIPKPYFVKLADKWTRTDAGISDNFVPSTYPVGMDIYYYGSYTADDPKEQAKLSEKVRDTWAISFASAFKRDVSISDMKTVKVADTDALYFETAAPRPGVIWRQWVFVTHGDAFVIVSSLRKDDKQLVADVEEMVRSFKYIRWVERDVTTFVQ